MINKIMKVGRWMDQHPKVMLPVNLVICAYLICFLAFAPWLGGKIAAVLGLCLISVSLILDIKGIRHSA